MIVTTVVLFTVAEFAYTLLSYLRGRTTNVANDDVVANATTASQFHCANAKLPSIAPLAMPVNMPTNSHAFKRPRAAGSRPKIMI